MTANYLKPLINELANLTPEQIAQPILDGVKSPILGLEEVQHLLSVLDDAKKLIADAAMDEAEKYAKGETIPTALGYRIEKVAGRRSFKFNDLTIKTAEQRVKELKECAKNGTPTSDGELLEKPLITYSKDYLRFTKIK